MDVSVGSPIFPPGVTVSARVAAERTEDALLAILALARAMEPRWRLQPHELPRAEQVPGSTCAVDGTRDVYDEASRRVGY